MAVCGRLLSLATGSARSEAVLGNSINSISGGDVAYLGRLLEPSRQKNVFLL